MRYLGIDYGTKRVGVALSDAEGAFAFPHAILPNNDSLMPTLEALVHEKGVGAIVLGDARALSGEANPLTARAENFADSLSALSLPVHLEREAWSSVEARRFTGDARVNDASAAAIILQRFLDAQKVQ